VIAGTTRRIGLAPAGERVELGGSSCGGFPMIDIRVLRAAGLTDAQILKVIEEDQAKQRTYERIKKQKQRARPRDNGDIRGQMQKPQRDQHSCPGDGGDTTYLTSLPSVLITSLEKEERSESMAPAAYPKYPPAFEEFYRQYPRHEGKRDALKVWLRIKTEVTHTELIAGAMRYAADPNRDPTFTKHCATWLNKGCWSDGPLPPRGGQQNGRGKETPIEQAERLADEWSRRERAMGIHGEADDAGSYRGGR
jgi:hypothetical protein